LRDILDPVRVAAAGARDHVIAWIRRHRELAAVQRRVAEPGEPPSVSIFSVTKFRPG
jgi:hypothetical protein